MRIRSGYSFRTAVGHLEDVADRVKEIGWERWPLCDRMSTFGFARATKLAKARGLSMIYGVEIPCVYELGDKKPTTDCWTFFAIDDLRPLHELVSQATDNPGKEPSLTYAQALNATGVVAVAGERLLVDRLPETLPGHFFVSLGPSTPIGLLRRAIRRQLPFIATSDNYYPRPEDLEFYRATLGRRAGTQTYPRHIMSDEELKAWLLRNGVPPETVSQAFANRLWAMEQCRATLKQATLLKPERPATLRRLCEIGAAKRGVDLKDPVYAERLDRELATIADKDFEDYFYILADLMAFAKENMVIGPARGSSCGSLVCYLLEITAIDPIPFGLIFERFIDLNRKDLPDIDADFSDAKRHLVFEYAEQKYGKDRVARLGTVGMFKAKSALNQAGMSLQIPKWRTDKLADSIIERSSGDSRVMNSLEDTLLTTDAGRAIMKEHPEIIVSARMEGHPSVSSQHAAGLLLTQDPIAEYVAVNARTRAAWCDKKDAETLNLLKVDALGLTQLSIFERTLELIGERPTSHYLERIPFDDPVAFEVLNKKQYAGIFQFTGTALRSLANQITFEKLDDLVAMTALARPGPLASGGAMAWINRRNGEPVPPPLHPLLGELTADTYGVVMYQETVMKITRELGQFSWADTAAIRKLMSNRSGDEAFRRFEDQFLQGATDNGMSRDAALTVWKQIDTMGSWAFNKSHAVAYGIVSYWCCWLKGHYPLEFAAATLDAEADPAKQLGLLRELDREGTKYRPVDPDHSTHKWEVAVRDGQKILVGPLTAIKGVGSAKVNEVIAARAAGKELKPGLRKLLENAKTEIDSLNPIADRVRELHPDLTKINIFSTPWAVKDVQAGVRGEVMIFALVKKIAPRDENEAINVQKRGGKIVTGPTQSLNSFFADDTDEIFCKVDRFNYERMGRKIVEEGKTGKSLYAIKGTVPPNFRMIQVKAVRYLGEMD